VEKHVFIAFSNVGAGLGRPTSGRASSAPTKTIKYKTN